MCNSRATPDRAWLNQHADPANTILCGNRLLRTRRRLRFNFVAQPCLRLAEEDRCGMPPQMSRATRHSVAMRYGMLRITAALSRRPTLMATDNRREGATAAHVA